MNELVVESSPSAGSGWTREVLSGTRGHRRGRDGPASESSLPRRHRREVQDGDAGIGAGAAAGGGGTSGAGSALASRISESHWWMAVTVEIVVDDGSERRKITGPIIEWFRTSDEIMRGVDGPSSPQRW